MPLDEVVEHTRALDRATTLPVSIDLENGYGPDPADAATAIARVAEAGAVGGSIEDYDPAGALYDLAHAVERVAAACEAVRGLDVECHLVTARAENQHPRQLRPRRHDRPPTGLRACRRRRALRPRPANHGRDPRGLRRDNQAVNVLARPDHRFAEITAAGAQRVGVGGELAWVAVDALVTAAERIRDGGDFSALAAPGPPPGSPDLRSAPVRRSGRRPYRRCSPCRAAR